MVKYLLYLALLLIPQLSNAQACYWDGVKLNATCYACAPNSTFPLSWKQSYCPGYSVPTCQTSTSTQTQACPSGYNGSVTTTTTNSCPNPYGPPVPTVSQTNTCVSTCQPVTQTQSLSCPANYSGSITQTNTKTCPSNQWQGWTTTSNTCTPNPPTCKPTVETKTESCGAHYTGQKTYQKTNTCSDPYGQPVQGQWVLTSNTCQQEAPTCKTGTQTQTLQCQAGYTGAISQTQSSTCPDPYGQPVWGAWITTSDTCQKSITNVSNPTSPVSPISSVMKPMAATPSPAPQPQPAMLAPSPTPEVSAPAPTAPTASAPTTSSAPATAASPTPSAGSNNSGPPKKGSTVGKVLALDIMVKPSMTQPSVFPNQNVGGEIPKEMLMQDKAMMDMLFKEPLTQTQLQEGIDLSQ